MNARFLSALLGLLAAPVLPAATIPETLARIEAAPTADASWELYRSCLAGRDLSGLPPRPGPESSAVEQSVWSEKLFRVVWDAGQIFVRRFPDDPRRWDVTCDLYFFGLAGENEYTPEQRAAVEQVTPAAERDVRRAEILRMVAALRASPQSPARMRWYLDLFYEDSAMGRYFQTLAKDWAAGRAPDTASFLKLADDLIASYPEIDPQSRGMLAVRFVDALKAAHLPDDRIIAAIEPLLASRYEDIREMAQSISINMQLVGKTPEIAFTALDGREIDLKNWRGKVVLIDCWATWCGPCKAELPNLKRVYAEYHDKGFEVIGLTAEKVFFPTNATPEQKAEKIEASRKVLSDFVAQAQIPWPQHFSELGFKNPFYKQFGVTSIPLMVLIGPDGKIITTDVRGEKLEPAVKRLLKP